MSTPAPPVVLVRQSTGEAFEVPAGEAARAVDSGDWRRETPEETATRLDRERLTTPAQKAITAAEGVARGATLGLSDVALKSLGAETAARKAASPGLALGGEIAGTVAPLVLGGAPGIVGTVARTVGAPVRATQAIGQTVARGVLAKAGVGLGARMAAGGAQAATEAIIARMGANLSETVLGDHDITAQRMLAGTGEAALLGGGLGMAAPLAAKAIESGVAKARKALDRLNDAGLRMFARGANATRERLATEMARTHGDEAAAHFRKMTADPGTDAGALYRQQILNMNPETRNQIQREYREALEASFNETERALDRSFAEFRPAEIKTLLGDVSPAQAQKAAAAALNSADDALAAMLADPVRYPSASAITHVQDVVRAAKGRVYSGKLKTAADVFDEMNDAKVLLDKKVSGWHKDKITPDNEASAAGVMNVRAMIKQHLEDATVYGQAATRQMKRNEAVHEYLTARSALGTIIGEQRPTVRKAIASMTGEEFDFIIASKKVNAFANQIGADRSAIDQAIVDNYQARARALLDEVEASATTGKMAFDKAGAQSLLDKLQTAETKAGEMLGAGARLRAMANAPFVTALDPAITAAATAATGSMTAGTVLGTMAGAARDPQKFVRTLAAVEGFSMRTVKELGDTAQVVAKHLGRAIDFTGRGGIGVGEPLLDRNPIEARVRALDRGIVEHSRHDEPDKRKAFAARTAQLAAAIAEPEKTAARLSDGLAKLDEHAPETKAAIVRQQMRILDYLHRTAPKDPLAGRGIDPRVARWQPSDQEISRWQRRVEAANNPRVLLDELARGVVARETVDTVRELYPAIFEQMQRDVMTNVTELRQELTYNARVNLGMIFGVPVDASTRPEFVARMQAAFRKQAAKPARASGRKFDAGADVMTTSERLAAE